MTVLALVVPRAECLDCPAWRYSELCQCRTPLARLRAHFGLLDDDRDGPLGAALDRDDDGDDACPECGVAYATHPCNWCWPGSGRR